MLSQATSRYLKLRRPLVAGLLAPSAADKALKGGVLSYLEVIPTKKSLAGTYFPLGYNTKGDVAIAPMLFEGRSAEAINSLRKRGNVLVISEAKMKRGVYVFKGIMLSFQTNFIGNMAWHVATGIFPPLKLGKEELFKSPPLLATLESVISGTGLYVFSESLVPINRCEKEVPKALTLPLAFLGLATWRRDRLASRKKAEERSEASREG